MIAEPNQLTEATPALDLSLFRLDEGLRGLIEYRQERLADRENPPDAEELAALGAEIRTYTEALPRKVSGVVAMLRQWKAQISTAKAERERLAAVIANIQSMVDTLEEICAEVIAQQPAPRKGSRKLVGVDGSTLALVNNGGIPRLIMDNPELLPDGCCRMDGWISAEVWTHLRAVYLDRNTEYPYSFRRVPDTAAIRAKLLEDCPECEGGYQYDTSQCDEFSGSEKVKCPTCAGTGKNAVPGAYLAPRGAHLEVR